MSTLIITEKNKAAEVIANAIGSVESIKKAKSLTVYSIPSKNIYVIPLRGHILEYRNTFAFKSWTKTNPRDIITNPEAIEKVPISYAGPYIKTLKEYSKISSHCIIGTDADIEGCNIGLFDALPFIKHTNPNIKVSQLWLSSLQKDEIINKFTLRKQSADLCSNIFSQYVAYEYISGGYLDKQVEEIRGLYKRKRDVMLKALEEFFPKEAKWTIPSGGMFLWVTLPKRINTRLMFPQAVAKKVAYVVGDAFYTEGGHYNSMRLNFSYSEDDDITEAIRRLAEVIKEELARTYEEEPILAEGI